MKKYSKYQSTIFLGIDQTQQLNEGIFSYFSNLIKRFDKGTINKDIANVSQHDFAYLVADSITKLKFKTFSFYTIVFNLKDVLKIIQTNLLNQIAEDKKTYNGVILKEDYKNGENFIYSIERMVKRIEDYIKKEAYNYITLKYPISKITSDYTDNKKIVKNFINNFNVIFKPYKKTTWLFTKKIKDISPYEMLINDIVKAYGKEFFKIENAIIQDDEISQSDDFNYTAQSLSKIDLNELANDFKVELTAVESNFYKHLFDTNKLAVIQKDFKDQNKLYGDEYNTPEFFQIIKNLSELGFKIVFNEKFSGVNPNKLTYSMVERNIRNKNIVFAMTTAYSKKMAGGNVFNRDNPNFDDSNTMSEVPEGHEPDFLKNVNKYFNIRKRNKLITTYSDLYNIEFKNDMFKITHSLAIQSFKKYIYEYDQNPESELDMELLLEIFNTEYNKYIKSKQSDTSNYDKYVKDDDENEDENENMNVKNSNIESEVD